VKTSEPSRRTICSDTISKKQPDQAHNVKQVAADLDVFDRKFVKVTIENLTKNVHLHFDWG